ncbi:MAG: hypothetical protein NZ908_00220, partial [Candidatus Micrarchaeota archaeon]|nr:hypothetical protein [Candidatus Micrarchaeota archaeon]
MEKTAIVSIIVFIISTTLITGSRLHDNIYINLVALIGISLAWIGLGREGGVYFLISMLLASIYATTSFEMLRTVQELPSPIIGGDYYAQLGQINYMNRTLDLFGNHYYSNKIFSYNPIYSWLAVLWMKISGMNGIDTMKHLSTFLLYLNIVWYIIAFRITNQPVLSLGVMLFSISNFPYILKYTEFASQIVSVIVLYLLQTGIYWLSLALSFISHFILFGFTGMFIAYRLLLEFQTNRSIVRIIKNNLMLITIAVSILFIVITRIDLTDYFPRMRMDFPNYSRPEGMEFLVKKVLDFLLNDLMIIPIIIYLFTIYRNLKIDPIDSMILIFVILLISSPILDALFRINIVPSYSLGIVFKPLILLGMLYRIKDSNQHGMIAGIILIIAGIYELYSEFPERLKSISTYKNITLADTIPSYVEAINIISRDPGVVLSNKPISFLINSYTGSQVVTSRWAQSFHLPFLNFSNRDLDAAIMLYSEDRQLAQQLLREYRVKYIVFDVKMFSILEFQGRVPQNMLKP